MDDRPNKLGQLILLRVIAIGNPPTRAAFEQALHPYFANRLGLTDGQWRELLNRTLDELVQQGFLDEKPYRLTDAGQSACLEFLDRQSLPHDLRWSGLRNLFLVAKALGVMPSSPQEKKRFTSSDGFRACLIMSHFGLNFDHIPTLHEVLEALAMKKLSQTEVPQTADERDEALRAALIPGQPGEFKLALPAAIAKSQNSTTESLRRAVINTWLDDCDNETCCVMAVEADAFSLPKFAKQILDLAHDSRMEKFGGNKVFLSHLWDSYQDAFPGDAMTRAEFDGHLLEANRHNLVTLSRADLITAMDPNDVDASEISLSHATFHFLRTDGDQTHAAE